MQAAACCDATPTQRRQLCATKKIEKKSPSAPWAYFANGPNAAASIAPTLIRHCRRWTQDMDSGSRLYSVGGVVALSVECQTCDQEVVGSTLGWACGIKTLGKFLTPVCLCSPSSTVQVATGLRVVMPCGWGVKAGMVCVGDCVIALLHTSHI